MTRTTVITGIVAGVGVVAVTAGLAAAVNNDLGGQDERVEAVSISTSPTGQAQPSATDSPSPTATATTDSSSDDRDDDRRDDVSDRDSSDDAAVTVPAGITSDRAVEIALAKVPGTLDEIYLESESGLVVWDVDVYGADGWEHEIYVDARTGEIVKHERDDRIDD